MDLYNCNSLDVFTQLIKKYKDEHIIIVTDPPFNIGYKYNEYLDNMDETEYYEMNMSKDERTRKEMTSCYEILKRWNK